ncbi:lens fiber membrane intrinsic protein-like [Elysia marginata]|uniref:Lens fiber membrane intrinsic protein-like n=1 Tax=Elysia marginata TaxID=1093978 RepID=A0AAV4FZI5_9GAST|nr:lens fiber membrane intrinsic protein-like [Elysia marginata]
MGFKLVPLIAFGVLGLGNLLHIVGLATPEWVTADISVPFLGSTDTTRGLWEGCIDGECDSYDKKTDWLKACQAMAILGMLAGLVAALMAGVVFVMGLMKKDSTQAIGIIALLSAISSFIMILICVIVFAVKMKEGDSGWDFGYSFGLSIAGALLIAIGGGIAFGGSR